MVKNYFLILAVILLVAAVFATYMGMNHQNPSTEAVLEVTQPVIDFDVQGQGQVLTGEFDFMNTGLGTIQVLDVVSSCDCASVEPRSFVLSHDDKVQVIVKWRTGLNRGPSGTNLWVHYEKTPGIRFQKKLRLQANIEPDIQYEPTKLVFTAGISSHSIIKFYEGKLKSAIISEVSVTHKAFSITRIQDRIIEIKFDSALWTEIDPPDVWLLAKTNSLNEPLCRIPLAVDPGPPKSSN